MVVGLLYQDADRDNPEPYFDRDSIIGDLGLEILFDMSSKDIIWSGGQIKKLTESDPFLKKTMAKVMMVPLQTKEEILYRQAILKDCIANPEFVQEMYSFVQGLLDQWNSLGRGVLSKKSGLNSPEELVNQIHVNSLFLDGLGTLKRMLAGKQDKLESEGFQSLTKRFLEEFSDDYENDLRKIMEDIRFFIGEKKDTGGKKVSIPKIKLELSYDSGLKFRDWHLIQLGTDEVRQYSAGNPMGKLQNYISQKTPDSLSVASDSPLATEASRLEYHVVNYVLHTMDPFVMKFKGFFDKLYTQIAFYRGALLLRQQMKRLQMVDCFPEPGEKMNWSFTDLKEVVMGLGQLMDPIGNDGEMKNKNLVIVTGANQGGKSTYLRSVGIAQIMMQCGLMVGARNYSAGIYPEFFTHFTRREDSEMNSGRLDEELGRMSQIIDHVGRNSIVLLNESFATTTEKDGSEIAYGILHALWEKGVTVLTVTHLLGFAKRMYEDEKIRKKSEFLSAERLSDGQRTFKMVQGEPALSSFGLDLYEKIIG